ncbi:MAG: ATP-binding protein, partial [Candidatus Latescibacteria bacterium]|nr:ATP-binding protein [Candidatus Latescibacterota bacterium]
RELADLLPQIACETDTRGNLTFVNRNAFDAFGYTPDELEQGINIFQMLVPGDLEKAREGFSQVIRGEGTEGIEYTALRKDGSTFPIIIYARPIIHNGVPEGVRAVVVDITERQRAEEELRKMQRLESIGVLAGGIAHDYNNILTAILGNISLILLNQDLDDETQRRLREAEAASIQARSLTHQLLTFSKGGTPVKKTVAVEGLMKDAVGFSLRGANVVGKFSFSEDLGAVEVDEGQIGQVLNNLVINAKQAMPEGGSIDVSAGNVDVMADSALPLEPGRYVRISVADQGTGIPAAHLSRIFDPYFTTKQEGSGLGLAVCYSVINGHDGHITVESELGVGSTFHVYLPASADSPADSTDAEASWHVGGGRVLIMDDEEIVRYVAGGILEETGYEVAYAENGEEAIRLYQEAMAAGHSFDVVLMDLTVPGGMGGKECIHRIREIDPDVKAIVSSGYAEDPVMAEYRDHGFSEVVPKPYKMAGLCAAVHRLVEQRRAE